MARTPEIAEAHRLARAIEGSRKASSDTHALERQFMAFLRQNQAALERDLREERDLFYVFPERWEDIRALADTGLGFYLDAIREFSVEGWRGDRLQPELFLLGNLETVFMGGNRFESIAGDYRSLTKLQKLVCEEVWALRVLDDPSVAEAPTIKEVYVNACGLEVFPRQLFNALTLEVLEIGYCNNGDYSMYPFFGIPSGASKLKNLKTLSLAGLGITNIAQDWLEMPWLEKLNLLSNEIPPEDQKRLCDALPNTQILFD